MCCSSVPFFTILATGLEEGSRGRLYYVDNDDGGDNDDDDAGDNLSAGVG